MPTATQRTVIQMKHAVILAHPNPASFCAAIAATCVEALQASGGAAILRDLYRMDFDPCMKAAELPTQAGFAPEPDVVAERQVLADVDSFVFVYPFWFNAPPAILKGYVDRVFCMGFGFRPVFGGTEPLLTGRRLTSFTTSGAPDRWVRSTGAVDALRAVFDDHLAAVCGLTVQDHRHFGSVLSNLTEESARDMLAEVGEALAAAFGDLRRPT